MMAFFEKEIKKLSNELNNMEKEENIIKYIKVIKQ